jgi:hypothetical protein
MKKDQHVFETIVRCTCFISFVSHHTNELEGNNLRRFLLDEDIENLRKIELNQFIKYLNKIIELSPNEEYPKVLKDILSDYAICQLIFEKFEGYINLFFSNR